MSRHEWKRYAAPGAFLLAATIAIVLVNLGDKPVTIDDTAGADRHEVARTVRRVVDKLLHAPTVRVQELAADSPSVDYAAALRELFALDPHAVAAVMSTEVPR